MDAFLISRKVVVMVLVGAAESDAMVSPFASCAVLVVTELSKANYSTIEQQSIQFGMYSLRPTVKRYEVELERKLFLDGEDYDVKFDLRGLMRGDTSARGEFYSKMMHIFSVNEVRAWEGMEPIEGGDVHMVPLNMIPLEQLGKDGSNEVKK